MSEIEAYRMHGTEGMLKSIGGPWVKRTDHETAIGDLAKAADDLAKRVGELVNGDKIIDVIAAEAKIAKLESEKKMLRAGECPECETSKAEAVKLRDRARSAEWERDTARRDCDRAASAARDAEITRVRLGLACDSCAGNVGSDGSGGPCVRCGGPGEPGAFLFSHRRRLCAALGLPLSDAQCGEAIVSAVEGMMADSEEMLSGVVALANGAVVKLRFPEAELERFVEIATNGDCLLRAVVPPDGWTCELLAPGYAPHELEKPAVQSIATGPHWAGEGVVRTCGRCGESGLLDVMRCKCVDEEPLVGFEPQPGSGTVGAMEKQLCAVHGITRATVVHAPELSGPSARVVRVTIWTEGIVDTRVIAQAIYDATPSGVALAGAIWERVPDQEQDVVGWTYGESREDGSKPEGEGE